MAANCKIAPPLNDARAAAERSNRERTCRPRRTIAPSEADVEVDVQDADHLLVAAAGVGIARSRAGRVVVIDGVLAGGVTRQIENLGVRAGEKDLFYELEASADAERDAVPIRQRRIERIVGYGVRG